MNFFSQKWFVLCFRVCIVLVMIGVLLFLTLLGIILYGSHDEVDGDPDIMIVLGCQVKPWGPSILLRDRLDKALEYLNEHPDVTVVVSGGQGPDEHISEAQAMYEYLVENGVNAERVLQEDRSTNTRQNLDYSLALLKENGFDTDDNIIVVSNGFHLARVRMIWGWIYGDTDNLSTLAAPSSHVPSRLKMYIREPIGLVKSFVFDR